MSRGTDSACTLRPRAACLVVVQTLALAVPLSLPALSGCAHIRQRDDAWDWERTFGQKPAQTTTEGAASDSSASRQAVPGSIVASRSRGRRASGLASRTRERETPRSAGSPIPPPNGPPPADSGGDLSLRLPQLPSDSAPVPPRLPEAPPSLVAEEPVRDSSTAPRPPRSDRPETTLTTRRSTIPPPPLSSRSPGSASAAVVPGESARPAPATSPAPPVGPVGPVRRTPSPNPSAPRQPSAQELKQLERLVADALAKVRAMKTYKVTMIRQERVGGTLQPEETVVLNLQREPRAVRLEWPEGPQKGREVLFAEGSHGGLIHVKLANLPGVLPRMSFAPNNPMVTRNSRHPIQEAGFEGILLNIEKALTADQSTKGQLWYAGVTPCPDLKQATHEIRRLTPSGEDWTVRLDTQSLTPVLVIAQDQKEGLLEYYKFQDTQANPTELAAADAFDPDLRWGRPPSLLGLGRLAGGVLNGESPPKPKSDSPARTN